MNIQNIILICILIICTLSIGLLGYIIGRINTSSEIIAPSFFKKNQFQKQATNISIDETKVVTNIDTSGLEKKYDSLGDKKQSEENITNSVNRLKTLKG